MPFKEDPALARVAAKLSASVRQGASSRGLAELLRARFPDAILVRVSVPSTGLANVVLINSTNALEGDLPLLSLAPLGDSAAGLSFSRNEAVDSAQPCLPEGAASRMLADAQHARERWGADRLLCCPIPVSLSAAIARMPLEEDAAPSTANAAETALGVVTLGLRSGAAPTADTESALRQLARHLAETIERDSRALVQEVCVHMLGAQRVPGEPEEAPARQLSSSCSDEAGDGSSGDPGPPSGSLPIPVTPGSEAGGKGGSGKDGAQSGRGPAGQGKHGPSGADEGKCGKAASSGGAQRKLLGSELPSWQRVPSFTLSAEASVTGKARRMGAISPYELRSKGGIDIAALSAGSKLLGKAGAGEVKSGQAPPRTLTMAFSDARTERRFAIWHAKQRWRMDATALLLLLTLSVKGFLAAHGDAALTWRAALGCALHAAPLLLMAASLPLYLRKREQVLGVYLLCAAVLKAYGSPSAAAPLQHAHPSLAALLWFTRVQSAEALLLNAVMLAVRVRTALAVQALCVIIAASRAAAVCASCCMITSPPAACLLKALAAQVAFGYALPITLLHAAEGGFRHVFAEACAYMA